MQFSLGELTINFCYIFRLTGPATNNYPYRRQMWHRKQFFNDEDNDDFDTGLLLGYLKVSVKRFFKNRFLQSLAFRDWTFLIIIESSLTAY